MKQRQNLIKSKQKREKCLLQQQQSEQKSFNKG